jgi:hypothetical protein
MTANDLITRTVLQFEPGHRRPASPQGLQRAEARDRLPHPGCYCQTTRTSSSASPPHGCPGPSARRRTRGPAAPAPPARPASVTVSRTATPVISAPAFPAALVPGDHAAAGRTQGCMPDSAAHVKPGHAVSTARPWPSVEIQRLHRPRGRHRRGPLHVRARPAFGPHGTPVRHEHGSAQQSSRQPFHQLSHTSRTRSEIPAYHLTRPRGLRRRSTEPLALDAKAGDAIRRHRL